MSPLRLRGSCFFRVLVVGIFAASVDDSPAASISANDYAGESIPTTATGENGSRYTFKFWNSQEGLPRNSVSAIAQSHDGYLWVGTVNGLGRFDGVRFQNYTAANTPELFSDTINVLYEDRLRRLWVGTVDGGIACYDQGRFALFANADGLRSITINAITEDGDGVLWVGTAGGLHHMISAKRFERVARTVVPVEVIAGLRTTPEGDVWVITLQAARLLRNGELAHTPIQFPSVVRCFELDRSGDLWLGWEKGGLARIRVGTMTLTEEDLSVRATSLYRDRDGILWLGSSTGELWRRNPEGGWGRAAKPAEAKILAMQHDAQGNLWLGIDGVGLGRLRENIVETYSIYRDSGRFPVTSMAEDHKGRIWTGTLGAGLFRWEDNRFISTPIDPTALNVTALLCDRNGNLVCGTIHVHHGELYRREVNGAFLLEPEFGKQCRTVFEDREGGLWVGKWRGGVEHYKDGVLTRYVPTNGLSNDRIFSIAQDQQGAIWIGTLKGLNRLANGKITAFYREDGLGGNDVRVLFVDREGTLWAGSSGGGLTRYRDGRFAPITTREGLISNWVEQILEDNEGNLWLGSNAGLMRASLQELNDCASGKTRYVHCMAFRPEEELSHRDSGTGYQPSCLKTRAGQLWFGTESGVIVIDPKRIKPNRQPPLVYIEKILIDGEASDVYPKASSRIVIPPDTQRLEFHYTGLELSAPTAVRFKYKLEGYDREWVNTGTRREAVYTGVPAGDYQFRVTAVNNDGFWNETGATLAITVVPPWWQSWWFRMMALGCLTGMVFGAYELRVHQHRKARTAQELLARRLIESQEQERKRVAGELHDSLGQSLQVIKGRAQLGLNRAANSPASAKEFEEISSAATQAIHEVRAISHALRPAELDQLGLARAIEWMVQRTNATSATRFGCEVDGVNGLPPETEISLYRIAQEGIQNILKHAQATEAILQLQREPGAVRFSIFDNGRGLAKPPRSDGHGLLGITERVRLLGGEFDIQSAPGKGTRLTVTIPT